METQLLHALYICFGTLTKSNPIKLGAMCEQHNIILQHHLLLLNVYERKKTLLQCFKKVFGHVHIFQLNPIVIFALCDWSILVT